MNTLKTLASGALLLAAVSVSAQDAPDEIDPAHMDTPQAEEAIPAGEAEVAKADIAADAAVETDFTDEQITAFVGAAMEIRGLDPERTLEGAQRQAQAEGIVAEHGLDPETYNAIGVAAQSDPEVAQRVQLAIAAVNENGAS